MSKRYVNSLHLDYWVEKLEGVFEGCDHPHCPEDPRNCGHYCFDVTYAAEHAALEELDPFEYEPEPTLADELASDATETGSESISGP